MRALKEIIDDLKKELHQAHPDEIQTQIPTATDELDAVVLATENATNVIIGSCETIQTLLQQHMHPATIQIENEIIRIVEACTFQDITGQRIHKVTKALSVIDKRAAELSQILERNFVSSGADKNSNIDAANSLLNGPQLPGQGMQVSMLLQGCAGWKKPIFYC